MVRLWLRLEGLIVAVAAVAAYARTGDGWAAFLFFFLLPDLAGLIPFVVADRRLGAAGRLPRGSAVPGRTRTTGGPTRRGGTPGGRGRPGEGALVPPGWFLLYNGLHSYVLPLLLGLAGWWAGGAVYAPLAGWVAHIGVDRALGFGLKIYPYFRHTHLQLEEPPWRGSW